MTNTKWKVWILHLVGSIAFLVIPIALAPHPPEQVNYVFSTPTLRDLIANALMLLFFYLHYYFLISKVYFKKRYILYGFIILVAFLLICLLPSLLTGHAPWQPHEMGIKITNTVNGGMPVRPKDTSFLEEIKHHIFLFAVVILFSLLLMIRDRLFQSEREKYQAEVSVLKAQINPHFLFNTMNGIYAFAIREKASVTASSILKLSGMMRYVVTETVNGFISLEKEISYINDYIELQKMRLDKRVHISYSVIGDLTERNIAPLILISFIENAFKFGVNPDEDSSINVRIEIQENNLKLTVENNKVKVSLDPFMKSGKGIENTKSRLQLLYPDKHFLLLNEDENHFRVQLSIQLK
jgi:hypothetical protein